MLEKIYLLGFKSFELAELDIGQLSIAVGANAAGKSNIRDALRFLHGIGLGYSLSEILGGKYGPGGILQWRGIRGGPREITYMRYLSFGLKVLVRLDGVVYTYFIGVDVSDEQLGPRVVHEELLSGSALLYSSLWKDDPVKQESDHELRVRQPRGGNYKAHGKVSAFPSSTPVLAQLPHRKNEKASLRQICKVILSVFRSFRFLDLDPDAMRVASPPGQTIMGDRGENLSSVLQAICKDNERKKALLAWLQSLTPMDAVDFEFKYDLSGKVLAYFVEDSGQRTSAVSASDGTLRFMALVATLLSPDTGQVFFFEELDNGIHPTRLHLLLNLIQQACTNHKIQVIGTTHNPYLLTLLDDDALANAALVYRLEGQPDSRIRKIIDIPGSRKVLEDRDLGLLFASGWLEDIAEFSESDEENSEEVGE